MGNAHPTTLLVEDSRVWMRPDAPTLRERTVHRGEGERLGVGQHYSTLAWVPEESGSWALPLKHERITSFETPVSKATFQLKVERISFPKIPQTGNGNHPSRSD
ncbi:MAG: hypothetical protein ACKO24_13670 [Leptolyngbyaceae cyanobacterium]